jgi:hypothetical protein
MDRTCLAIVFASVIVLVTALSLVGAPQENESRQIAIVLALARR